MSRADAIAAWTALAQGRYLLVERAESDGQRHYVLVESSERQALLGLSPQETKVTELAARGLSNKLIAYSLGITDPVVSRSLARAAFKIGCRSRQELVALASALLTPTSTVHHTAALTEAELHVLELVRGGSSNAAIAQARGTSTRTVANQIGALLKKLGASSRREMLVRAGKGGAAP